MMASPFGPFAGLPPVKANAPVRSPGWSLKKSTVTVPSSTRSPAGSAVWSLPFGTRSSSSTVASVEDNCGVISVTIFTETVAVSVSPSASVIV